MRVCLFWLLLVSPFSMWGNSQLETPIFADFMPKSGSSYIGETLAHYFGLTIKSYVADTDPAILAALPHYIRPHQLCEYGRKKQTLIRTHAPPTAVHLAHLTANYDRFLFHVRDPRQVLVSYVNYYDKNYRIMMEEQPPQGYFSWSFLERVDWHIQVWYAKYISWLEQWLDVLDNPPNLSIHVSTFEQMVEDPVAFFQDIIAFYGADPDAFTERDLMVKQFKFRKGEVAEWRRVLTQEQQEAMTSMMSERMFERFHWER